MKKPRIVLVLWEDASSDPETWIARAAPHEAPVVLHEQVGWLLELNSKHLLMTCTVSDSYLGSRTRIPRAMVRKITTLKAA